jgi:hypothetical protein
LFFNGLTGRPPISWVLVLALMMNPATADTRLGQACGWFPSLQASHTGVPSPTTNLAMRRPTTLRALASGVSDRA